MLFGKIAILLLVVTACLATPTKLSFKKNQQFVYKLNADLDARGKTDDSSTPTGGALSGMYSTFVTKCVDIQGSSYLFITNMFGTTVSVDHKKVVYDPTGNQALGADMYFQQEESGNITQIWYQKGDSMDLVKIKVGAINSLQTFVVAPNHNTIALQPDPVGVHTSTFNGLTDNGGLLIQKTFTQDNFLSFSDPSVRKSNVVIAGTQKTLINTQGFIQNSEVLQTTVFVNNGQQQQSSEEGVDTSSETGFNMNLRSAGALRIQYQGSNMASSMLFTSSASSFDQLLNDEDYSPETLFGFSEKLVQFAAKPDIDFNEEMEAILSAESLQNCLARMDKVIRFLRFEPELIAGIEEVMEFVDSERLDRILFILANVGNIAAERVLVNRALFSSDKGVRFHTVLHIASSSSPASAYLIDRVRLLYTLSKNDEAVENTAILAIGSLIRRVPAEVGARYLKYLTEELVREEQQELLRSAFMNAGFPSQGLIDDSDFPYNRSFYKAIKLGGSKVSLDISGELFAGTNFDCNHPTFNYELLGRVKADGHVLGYSKNVFLAEAVYGKANGGVIGNHILVQIWDKVLYHKTFPMLDCQEHVYPIASTSPGFSFRYIVWVSVIPVTFHVTTALRLNLSWGWRICDSDLSAMAELIPTADFTFSGGAEIDLFIIQAGVEIVGSFNIRVSPEVYIHGSMCAVGFQVKKTTVPMLAKFDAYFRWKSCTFLIFNCKWGKHNELVIWSWSLPATDETLFKKEWKIFKSPQYPLLSA